MNKLKELNNDKEMLQEFKSFVILNLERKMIDNVFSGKQVTGFKEAKELLESAYAELENMFKPKEKEIDNSSE